MRPLRFLVSAVAFCVAASASAQQYVLTEPFGTGVFPPSGWSQVQATASPGWQESTGAAFHDDWAGVGGVSNDDLLYTPALDLSTLPGVWLHFENGLRWASFLGSHPSGSGNGASTVEVSTDGGATWAVAWNETRTQDGMELTTVDLGAWAGQQGVHVGFRYYGDFAHEWTVDRVFVGDDPAPPPPPGTPWAVNLPAAFAPAPLLEDFEGAAGVLQAHMATTSLNVATGLPSTIGWCNIGQQAPSTSTPYSGSYDLEMGLAPGAQPGTYVRNAFVLGVDNSAGYGDLTLKLRAKDYGEEPHPIDGIWISRDGVEWYPLADWGPAGNGFWGYYPGIDLEAAPIPVDGTFYLMFAQEDNYPFANQDGIAVDDIEVGGTPPPNPTVTTSSTCGGSMFLDIQGCTPGGIVGVGWAVAQGVSAVQAGPCAGLPLDLHNPKKLGTIPAGAQGTVNWLVQVPPSACGSLYVQVVDVESCLASPVLAL